MKTIWYLHGAYSTSRAFNWLKQQLPQHEAVNINYSSYTPVPKLLDQLIEKAAQEEDEFSIVGHSLGGVLGVALSQRCEKVDRVVTLASPFGGSRLATWVQFLAPGSLLEDIQPFSPLLTRVRGQALNKPVLSVVTTGGSSPLMFEPNDGVVTIRSQKAIDGPIFIEHELSHFEVLLDQSVATAIQDFIFG